MVFFKLFKLSGILTLTITHNINVNKILRCAVLVMVKIYKKQYDFESKR